MNNENFNLTDLENLVKENRREELEELFERMNNIIKKGGKINIHRNHEYMAMPPPKREISTLHGLEVLKRMLVDP